MPFFALAFLRFGKKDYSLIKLFFLTYAGACALLSPRPARPLGNTQTPLLVRPFPLEDPRAHAPSRSKSLNAARSSAVVEDDAHFLFFCCCWFFDCRETDRGMMVATPRTTGLAAYVCKNAAGRTPVVLGGAIMVCFDAMTRER